MFSKVINNPSRGSILNGGFLVVIFGFLISAVQVLPTAELLKLSSRQGDPRQVLSQFPYKPANLLQFLNPFILGSPKDATYPRWVPGKWGIFWENTAYVGILPLALALTVIVRSLLKRTKKFYISLLCREVMSMKKLKKCNPS